MQIYRSCRRAAIWLLIGALLYLALFGEPDFSRVATWGAVVFWPFVLAWYAFWWSLALAMVVTATIFIYRKVAA